MNSVMNGVVIPMMILKTRQALLFSQEKGRCVGSRSSEAGNDGGGDPSIVNGDGTCSGEIVC